MKYDLPYGESKQELEIDGSLDVELLEPQAVSESSYEEEALIEEAMESPVDSLKLRTLAAGMKTAVVICSDHTRPVPSKKIIPVMLRELRAENPEIKITLLVATGCHRGTTKEELVKKFGDNIVSNETIVVHDCDDRQSLVNLGKLPSGADLIINRLAVETDLLVAEGFIEPHFFAGFSGGRKSVLPGICARETVLGNHCASFISDPHAHTGILKGNPIHRDMEDAAKKAHLRFIVNVVLDEKKRIVAAFAGDTIAAHEKGCAYVEKRCALQPSRMADIAVTTNGGSPLDQNLYQSVKGMTAAEAVLKPGGAIIICASCSDGVGGVQFYRALKECESAETLLREIEKTPQMHTLPDQWQYQILARMMKNFEIYVVCDPSIHKEVEDMKMHAASSVQDAFNTALNARDSAQITVIPDGVSAIIKTLNLN